MQRQYELRNAEHYPITNEFVATMKRTHFRKVWIPAETRHWRVLSKEQTKNALHFNVA